MFECDVCRENTCKLQNYNCNWKRIYCNNCGLSIPVKKVKTDDKRH